MEAKNINLEKRSILRAKKDKEAFEFLYSKYFSRINNFVFHRVKDKHIKDEIVSNTFFKAMENIENFNINGYENNNFSAWLYRIAISEIGNYFRNEKKQKRVKEEINKKPDKGSPMKPDIDFETVREKMRELSEYEINLITLRFFEKLKHSEIAGILQEKTNTIRVQVHRALKKLYKLLEGDNHEKF